MADIQVVNPKGVLGTIPENMLDAAVAQGYRPATDKDRWADSVKEASSGIVGKVAAGTGAAADALTFGAFEAGLKKLAPESAEILDIAQGENPITTGIGTAAGIGGSLLASAPLKAVSAAGKVAGAETAAALGGGAAAKAAGTVARLGTEGALISTPKAAVELFTGDPIEAAETLAYGAGLGAAFGATGAGLSATGKGAKSLLGKFIDPAMSADKMADYFSNRATMAKARGIGLTKTFLERQGIEKVKEVISFMEERNLPTSLMKAQSNYDALQIIKSEAGPLQRAAVDAVDGTGSYFADTLALDKKISSIMRDIPKGELSAQTRALAEKGQADIQAVIQKRGQTTTTKLGKLLDLKQMLGEYAYNDFSLPRPGREVIAKMERAVNETLEESMEQADKMFAGKGAAIGPSAAGGRSGFVTVAPSDIFMKAKRDYHLSSLLEDALQKAAAKAESINDFNMVSGLWTTGGAVVGGTLGGAVVLASRAVGQRYGNDISAKVNDGIANFLRGRNKQITSAVKSFLYTPAIPQEGTRPVAIGALSRFAKGDESEDETMKRFTESLASAVTAPEQTTERLARLTDDMTELSPAVAAAVQGQLLGAAKYLHQQLPAINTAANPFNPQPLRPSDAAVSAFKAKLRAVLEPDSVLEDMKQGTADPASFEALQAVYPRFHQALITELVNQATSKPPVMTYDRRMLVTRLLGQQAEPALQGLKMLQQSYAQEKKNQAAKQAKLKRELYETPGDRMLRR